MKLAIYSVVSSDEDLSVLWFICQIYQD